MHDEEYIRINTVYYRNSISQVDSAKFLGVYIDRFLPWDEHIKINANRLARNIGIVRKLSHFCLLKC